MTQADSPLPGEDPGALIEDPSRLDEIEPSKPKPDVPEVDDPEVKDTEMRPTRGAADSKALNVCR